MRVLVTIASIFLHLISEKHLYNCLHLQNKYAFKIIVFVDTSKHSTNEVINTDNLTSIVTNHVQI